MFTTKLAVEITPNAKGMVEWALNTENSDWNADTKREASRLYALVVNFPTLTAATLLGVVRGTHEFIYTEDGTNITAVNQLN